MDHLKNSERIGLGHVHVRLTCKNHPNLIWACKGIAVNPNGTYNGKRGLFYLGSRKALGGRIISECQCPSSDLIIIPDDEAELEFHKDGS